MEMARLQSFPDGLILDCGLNQAHKMLGNAVPSLVAEVLGREIRAELLDKMSRSRKQKLLRPSQNKIPPGMLPTCVPQKFLQLEHNHPPHPGNGKGKGALARVEASA